MFLQRWAVLFSPCAATPTPLVCRARRRCFLSDDDASGTLGGPPLARRGNAPTIRCVFCSTTMLLFRRRCSCLAGRSSSRPAQQRPHLQGWFLARRRCLHCDDDVRTTLGGSRLARRSNAHTARCGFSARRRCSDPAGRSSSRSALQRSRRPAWCPSSTTMLFDERPSRRPARRVRSGSSIRSPSMNGLRVELRPGDLRDSFRGVGHLRDDSLRPGDDLR
jgi:hypothetical protein